MNTYKVTMTFGPSFEVLANDIEHAKKEAELNLERLFAFYPEMKGEEFTFFISLTSRPVGHTYTIKSTFYIPPKKCYGRAKGGFNFGSGYIGKEI